MKKNCNIVVFALVLFSIACFVQMQVQAQDGTAGEDYFTQEDSPRPNIVLIMSDDMGITDIGCYGGEIQTPNLNALAEGGVRFKQFYNTSRCCPSRASLLTGLYSHQAGIGHMMQDLGQDGYRGELAKDCVTIAEVLQPAGYSTYVIGKWHVTKTLHDGGVQDNWPLQRGFDRFYGMVSGAGSFFDPKSLSRGNKNISPENDPLYKPETYYFTDAISDNAVMFLRDHYAKEKKTGTEKPFFAYVAYTAAHWPMHALPKDIAKYKGKYDQGWDELRKTRLEQARTIGLIDKKWGITPRGKGAPEWKKLSAEEKKFSAARMEVYAAMVDNMDQGIGRIVAELKKQGKFENTLILYLQDNGACAEPYGLHNEGRTPRPKTDERQPPLPKDYTQMAMIPNYTRDGRPVYMGRGVIPGPADTYVAYGLPWANASNTPFRLYKHWSHEGGISSPLVVSWPALFKQEKAKTGGWCNQPGHLIDLLPTCADVAGATYPKKRNAVSVTPCEGVSLVSAFLGKKLDRNTLYWEHEGHRAIRQGDWKLVARNEQPWELYNLAEDRCELDDLAEEMPEKVAALNKLWNDWADRAKVSKKWPMHEKKK